MLRSKLKTIRDFPGIQLCAFAFAFAQRKPVEAMLERLRRASAHQLQPGEASNCEQEQQQQRYVLVVCEEFEPANQG